MTATEAIWCKALLPAHATVQQAISNLNESLSQIVLVVNAAYEIEGNYLDAPLWLYACLSHARHAENWTRMFYIHLISWSNNLNGAVCDGENNSSKGKKI